MESLETNTPSPEVQIMGILNEIMQLGANDFELDHLNKILDGVKNKTYPPIEAIEEATKILQRKQSYH